MTDLSLQELHALRMVAQGYSNEEIGEALAIRENTVRTNTLYYLKQKLGIEGSATESRVKLAIYALQQGYIDIKDIPAIGGKQ